MEDLKENIKNQLTEAVKAKNEITSLTLRGVLAAIINKEIEKSSKISRKEAGISLEDLEKKSKLNNEEIAEVIASEAKKRREAILAFEKGKREDLIKKEKAELEILKKYLPEQLSEEELKKIVAETINNFYAKEIHPVKSAEGGVLPEAKQFNRVKDMGKIMAELMPKIKGKADGNMVSKSS